MAKNGQECPFERGGSGVGGGLESSLGNAHRDRVFFRKGLPLPDQHRIGFIDAQNVSTNWRIMAQDMGDNAIATLLNLRAHGNIF